MIVLLSFWIDHSYIPMQKRFIDLLVSKNMGFRAGGGSRGIRLGGGGMHVHPGGGWGPRGPRSPRMNLCSCCCCIVILVVVLVIVFAQQLIGLFSSTP